MPRIFPKPLLYHGAFSYFTETSQNSPKLESDFKGKEGWIGINSSLKTFFSQHSVISIKLVPADLTHKSSSSLSLSETKSDEGNVVVAKKYTCTYCQVFTDNFHGAVDWFSR